MFSWNSLFWCSNGCSQFDLCSFAFSKSRLNWIWNLEVHGSHTVEACLENFEHYFASVWDECNCVVVWTFFGIAFLWDWNENWPFLVLWPLLNFSNLLAYWVQYFHSKHHLWGFEIAQLEFHHLHCFVCSNAVLQKELFKELFVIFSYYPIDVCKVFCDIP